MAVSAPTFEAASKSQKGEQYYMDTVLVLKIIGTSEYNGMSRNGKQYTLTTLELDYQGSKVKIKCFESGAKVGDYAQIGIGTRKNIYGAEFAVLVERITPAGEIENNWK